MSARQYGVESYNGVRSAARLVIGDVGGLDAAAACTRVGRSVLAGYYAPGGENFIPADVVLDLERIGGRPRVTAGLARLAGYDLLPVGGLGEGVVPAELARLGRAVGEVFAEAAEALRDGEIDDAERARLLDRLADLRTCAAAVSAALSPPLPLRGGR